MKNILIWFTNDLRTHNHPALQTAIQSGDTILAIWVRENPCLLPSKLDLPRISRKRIQFQNESICALEKNLNRLSIPLKIFEAYNPHELNNFLEQNQIQEIYRQVTRAWEENQFTKRIIQDLSRKDLQFHFFNEPQILSDPTYCDQLPSLFTHFKKNKETQLITDTKEDDEFQISFEKEDVWKKITVDHVPTDYRIARGGENAAMSRLSEYFMQVEKVAQYFETRNALKGRDFSTKFSFWLSNGSLSPLSLLKRINRFEQEHISNKSTQWIKYELLWSLFFQLTESKHQQNCYLKSGIQRKRQLGQENNFDLFENWAKGETSNVLVNACMKELYFTGFLSNRGRQIAASYLIHDLKVNWTWGAYYFEHHLIDYQSANNWLNWQYIAGVGNDARPQRYFNPEKQAEIYDPEGIYANDWKKLQIQDIKG